MPLVKTKKEDFKDPEIYEYLISFFKEEIKDTAESAVQSDINNNLVPVLDNITLSQITSDWIIQLEKSNAFPNLNKASLSRFIGHLTADEKVADPRLYRIVECKIRFYNRVGKNSFETLLESEIYSDFSKKHSLSKGKNVNLLIAQPADTGSESLNVFFERYTNEFKLSEEYTVKTKQERLSHINTMITRFFANIDIKKLKSVDILKFLQSERIKRLNTVTFLDILIQLSKHKHIEDDFLNNFLFQISKAQEAQPFVIGIKDLIYYLSNFKSYSLIHNKKNRHGGSDVFLVTIMSPDIRKALINYIDTTQVTIGPLRKFINCFTESIKGENVRYLSDLNYTVFSKQVKYYKNKFDDSLGLRYLVAFYQFLMNNQKPVLNDIKNRRFIKRTSLGRNLYEGYGIVFYQPVEKVPTSDKWILSYTEDQTTNDGISATMTLLLDFTRVSNKKLRSLLKHYVWHYDSNINTKYNNYKRIIHFLNFIDDYSKKNILKLNQKSRKSDGITLSEIIGYRANILNKYSNNRTILGHIYPVREFINHIEEHELIYVETGYKHYLYYSRETSYNNAKPLKDSDFAKIIKKMKEKAETSDLHRLYMIVFYLLTATELRPSNVVSLRKDCVKEVQGNNYVIKTETKTSNKEIDEISITLEVKKQIDEAIRITEPSRIRHGDTKTNKYLFIVDRKPKGSYGVMGLYQFNTYLKDVCKELNISGYTASNLRDTHMTKAEQFIIEKNHSDIQQNIITGHKSTSVTEKHYIKKELKSMLESVGDITIGSNDIELNKDETRNRKEKFPYNKLLVNEKFFTTPDNLHYFEEHLKRVTGEIDNCKSIDKINELMNYKALIEKYIEKIERINSEEE